MIVRYTATMQTSLVAFLLLAHGSNAFGLPEIQIQAILTRGGVLPHRMSQVDEDIRQGIEMKAINDEAKAVKSDSDKRAGGGKAVLGVAVGSLLSVAAAAKLGVLPVPLDFEYTDALILRDVSTALLSGVLGYAYVKLCTTLAARGILQPRDSRKLIHTLSAPLYILLWPLYSPAGRCFAACVPMVNAVRLYLAASGDSGESELAQAVSRSGKTNEALGGPFVYVLVLISAISLFWRTSLIGITALSAMAAGDGMADIVGRRLGKSNKWFFSRDKSMAGSFAFVVSGSLCTMTLALWLSFTGCLALPVPMVELLPRIIGVTVACALTELLPIGDDNWTVPISAAALSSVFLQ